MMEMQIRELYSKSQRLLQGLDREEKRLHTLKKEFTEMQKRAYESLYRTKSKYESAKSHKRQQELQERLQEIESILQEIDKNLKGVAVSFYEIREHRKKVLQLDLPLPTC